LRAAGLVSVAAISVGSVAFAEDRPAAPATLAFVQRLTPDQQAEAAFLEHLGWRFVADRSAKEVSVHEGTPCYRRDLASAHAGGDLRVVVPEPLSDEASAALGERLASIADSAGTRCAYQQKVWLATREATRKLADAAERGDYTFPKILVIDSLWFRCDLPEPEWGKLETENLCRASPAKAIEAVYERGGVAECYTGQWIAIFATQYELYGAAWFDEVFAKEDLRVGRPSEMVETPVGRHVDESKPHRWRSLLIPEEDQDEEPGLVLARHGPKAFAGVTGVLQNDREDGGANQNFVIVSVTPRAVEAMKAQGGFARVPALTGDAADARRTEARTFSASELAECRRRYDAALADPVLSEVTVYVHPLGVVPLAEVVAKEVREHLRPMKVRLYTEGVADFLYQRYRSAWKARWLRSR
jgi:hypothetical protein